MRMRSDDVLADGMGAGNHETNHIESPTWLTFTDADVYAFWYEDAHLALVRFRRDNERLLFVIGQQSQQGLHLSFPGRLFTDRVLDEIEPIFFAEVEEPGGQTEQLALGAYFRTGEAEYGAYYAPGTAALEVFLFRIDNTGSRPELTSLMGFEQEQAAALFVERYGHQLKLGEA
ncbi:hypothetical protein [Alicyclobacillus shizuokensis]|uniref:hypothetical protein n=1 Tax=Alicyclobacillus shizuokensis TaxID=392014 RepID=UPI0012EE2301|nr:hypothetical protein [Alicyclobacillus shizuokensis]